MGRLGFPFAAVHIWLVAGRGGGQQLPRVKPKPLAGSSQPFSPFPRPVPSQLLSGSSPLPAFSAQPELLPLEAGSRAPLWVSKARVPGASWKGLSD